LGKIDDQGVRDIILVREVELGVERIAHGDGEDGRVSVVRIVLIQRNSLELVAVDAQARILDGLRAVRSGPASITGADEGGSVADTVTEVARVGARVTSRGDRVSVVKGGQQLLSAAIRRRNGGRILSDAQLSDATDIAAISLVGSPETSASGLVVSQVSGGDIGAWVGRISGERGGGLGRSDGGNDEVVTPGEGLALD
jgi:hypothetical protein